MKMKRSCTFRNRLQKYYTLIVFGSNELRQSKIRSEYTLYSVLFSTIKTCTGYKELFALRYDMNLRINPYIVGILCTIKH